MDDLEKLVEKTYSIMEDILLSGFQNIHAELLKEIETLMAAYELYGLYHGRQLLQLLHSQLKEKKYNLSYDSGRLTTSFAQLEFYLSCL